MDRLLLNKNLDHFFIKGGRISNLMNQRWAIQSSHLIKEFRLNKLMITEYQYLGHLFKTLNFLTCRNLAVSIVRYFTHQQIKNICQAFEKIKTPHFFVQLVRTLNFVNCYLNNMDKSLYFAFYEKEQYKKLEIQHIASISLQNSNSFLKCEQQFKTIMSCMSQKVSSIQPEIQTLKEVLINPDLPLPKLRRQTQGIFCSSPFQLFLVSSTFSDDSEEQFFTCFQQFKEFLNLEKEEEYLKQFITILKDKHIHSAELKKIKQVRYTPYQITAGTMHEYFLQGNELHNFIVGLFALTDVMVKATHDYIKHITDPLYRLVELTLRYNIYRNYVLAIEQYLPFVFRMYDSIYKETIDDGMSKPIYKFWRPALSKWYLQMNELHKDSEQVYMYCLTKLQNIKLKSEIQQLYGNDQLHYSKLMNAVEQSRFEFQLGAKTFNNCIGNGSEMSLFFDSSPQNYEMVVIQFNEYLIDISVNEQTVHWCGHTDHQLQQPYLDYENNLTTLLQQFYQNITHKQITKEQISSIAKINVQYMSTLQIKNRTLKKVMDFINNRYSLTQELQILGDFQEADKKLQYFNHKALILAVVNEDARPFYSIPPHYSPQKLIDMIDTNDSQNNSDAQPIEYLSESQNKEGESERSSKHNRNSFVQQESQNEDQVESKKSEKRIKRQLKSSKTFLVEQQEEEESNVVTKQYQIYHQKS